MFDSSVSADGILVGTCVEKTDVQWFWIVVFKRRQKHLLVEIFKIVII